MAGKREPEHNKADGDGDGVEDIRNNEGNNLVDRLVKPGESRPEAKEQISVSLPNGKGNEHKIAIAEPQFPPGILAVVDHPRCIGNHKPKKGNEHHANPAVIELDIDVRVVHAPQFNEKPQPVQERFRTWKSRFRSRISGFREFPLAYRPKGL